MSLGSTSGPFELGPVGTWGTIRGKEARGVFRPLLLGLPPRSCVGLHCVLRGRRKMCGPARERRLKGALRERGMETQWLLYLERGVHWVCSCHFHFHFGSGGTSRSVSWGTEGGFKNAHTIVAFTCLSRAAFEFRSSLHSARSSATSAFYKLFEPCATC
jgi:hypothetical protein